jgi:pimeloyl-ACP methyl ester carboxylesterase/DNA-binding CsgD family transcriptional regulator
MAGVDPNDFEQTHDDGGGSNREIDLEIVSNSWLSMTSSGGFDAMIESWARKIDAVAQHNADGMLVDQVVLRQFEPLDSLLSANTELRYADPLEREMRLTANPVMILSPDGTVAAAANGGESFFRIALGRRAGREWLCEESELDFDTLRRNIARRGNAGFAILRVAGPHGRETIAEAYALEVDGYVGIFTVVRSLALDWSPEVSDRLERAYGITAGESEICRLVFELRDIEDVALARGVAIDTVRTQVKRIFGKLGLHSKAELVKLLAMLCARTMASAKKNDLTWADPLGRETILTRPDGRKLAYSWTGAAQGRDVLFVHGGLPLFYLEPATQLMLEKVGVRLLCLSMPGHGSSDPPPKGATQLEDGLQAIAFLLAHLQRASMPCIASTSGMCFAMILASRPKPLVSAVVLMELPWNLTNETLKDMPTIEKTMLQLARRAPRVLDLVCKIGWKMLLKEGPDFYISRAFAGSQTDLRTGSHADIQPYLRAACRHLFAQGHSAFVGEVLKAVGNKPAEILANLKVPLHWLAPRDNGTWRAENLNAAKQMNARITVESVGAAADLLPYQRPDVFVRVVADLASDDPAARFAAHDDFAGSTRSA